MPKKNTTANKVAAKTVASPKPSASLAQSKKYGKDYLKQVIVRVDFAREIDSVTDRIQTTIGTVSGFITKAARIATVEHAVLLNAPNVHFELFFITVTRVDNLD